jgi:hypothetical protein
MEGLRTKKFETFENATGKNEVLGTDGDYIYIEIGETPRSQYDIAGSIPETVPQKLESKINEVLGESIGIAAFAELSRIELRSRYGVDDGMVLPRERLEDFPVELPLRSELTEQYEAFRILKNTVQQVLESSSTMVEHGDGSYCDQWYMEISERINNGTDGVDGLGVQQRDRVDYSTQLYRDCYGDGNQVTDFAYIELSNPTESEQLRLFGFAFEHGADVKVPVAQKSGQPLPVYPQSQQELDYALELLDEFPAKPAP